MKGPVLGIVFALLTLSSARTWRQLQRTHFLGQGTNDVAISILEKLNDGKQNIVFSPLGYSTLLTVIAEGARGNTRNQLASVLKLPEDTYAVRSTFNRVLSQMQENNVLNKPEYKNWFYVYKNYTVEESYKRTLKDNYFIDVREVDRDYYTLDDKLDVKPSIHEEATTLSSGDQKTPMEQPEKNSSEEDSKESEEDKKDKSDEDKKDKSDEDKKDKSDEDKKDKSDEDKKDKSDEDKKDKSDDDKKDKSEEDDSSEEKETPSKKTKKPTNIMKIKDKNDSPKGQQTNDKEEEKKPEEVTNDDKVTEGTSQMAIQSETTTQEEEQEKPDVQEPSSQIHAVESEKLVDTQVLTNIRTVREVSAFSTNQLSSIDTEREMRLKNITRMLVFNALYFRGNWSTPFSLHPEKQTFHASKNEKVLVDMIQAEGDFETGRIPELGARALDIPYQGERYSLLVLLPSEPEGLEGLLKKLEGFNFYNIDKHLTKLQTHVFIPKLNFCTISKPKNVFIQNGITDLFNQEADLSGISGYKGLYLEDLVQLVTLDIDENASSYNYLTSFQVSELRGTSTQFSANEPFVFFLRDKVEDLTIAAGVVNNPLEKSERK